MQKNEASEFITVMEPLNSDALKYAEISDETGQRQIKTEPPEPMEVTYKLESNEIKLEPWDPALLECPDLSDDMEFITINPESMDTSAPEGIDVLKSIEIDLQPAGPTPIQVNVESSIAPTSNCSNCQKFRQDAQVKKKQFDDENVRGEQLKVKHVKQMAVFHKNITTLKEELAVWKKRFKELDIRNTTKKGSTTFTNVNSSDRISHSPDTQYPFVIVNEHAEYSQNEPVLKKPKVLNNK